MSILDSLEEVTEAENDYWASRNVTIMPPLQQFPPVTHEQHLEETDTVGNSWNEMMKK